MGRMQYGINAYQRNRGNLPELPVINMFPERAPTETGEVLLQSRPGLADHGVSSGSSPVRAIFQQDGVLGGSIFTVANNTLYEDGAAVGTLSGSGPWSIAGNEIGVAVTGGSHIYFYDGTSMAPAAANGYKFVKVFELIGRFVAIRKDTQRFYWTDTLANAVQGGFLTFDALDFASAESEPDRLLDGEVIDGVLALGGSETVEFWTRTGNNDLPFSPIQGREFERGVRATGCMTRFDNSAAYIGRAGLVYRVGQVPERISTEGIEERVQASTSASCFSFLFEGHNFLAVRLDNETMLFDAQTGQWCEFETYAQTNWLARCATETIDGPIFGGETGKTYEFGPDYDDDGALLERRFRAGLPMDGGAFSAHNIRLRVNVGQSNYLTGAYANPDVEMRTSRDAAQTWGDWRATKLGERGEYRTRPQWRSLGMFDEPGILAEFRVTDPVPFRISAVLLNEPLGGRGR